MLTKVWLCVRPKNLKGCCNLMTSELPFSKRGVTISPFPNGRKLDGTRTNASQKKSFSFSQKHELKNTTLFISLKREFTKTELCSLIVLFILSWASVYLFILYIFFFGPDSLHKLCKTGKGDRVSWPQNHIWSEFAQGSRPSLRLLLSARFWRIRQTTTICQIFVGLHIMTRPLHPVTELA